MILTTEQIVKTMYEFCDKNFQNCECDHKQVFRCNYTFWYPNTTDRNVRLEECRELEGYCQNACYSYFCQFYKKYGSEVYYTLKKYHEEQQELTSYNFLSIGCGPCTELLGVLKFVEEQDDNTLVTFTGIDTNTNWKPIHSQWQNILQDEQNITFSTNLISSTDILNIPPNILILNYILSHVSQYNNQLDQQEFFEYIATIVRTMPAGSIILITEENNTNPSSGLMTTQIIKGLFNFLNNNNLINNRLMYQFPPSRNNADKKFPDREDYGDYHRIKKGVFENYTDKNYPDESEARNRTTYSTVDWCTGLQNIMVVR